ncbi:MAG: hypothetical protein KA821_06975 [Chitinophagaceae bacterium]|nr:hypothetical protein [Chitinophagaceae bacterium]
MGIGSFLPSIHKSDGWQGQYVRIIRWYIKFERTNPGNFESPVVDEEHDILYACFQNIFILKDWLHHSGNISTQVLNKFINENLELQLCRDIANGTKHFNLSNASVDNDFTIIREYQHFHMVSNTPPYKVIILASGHKFDLKELAFKCINLWEQFIRHHGMI